MPASVRRKYIRKVAEDILRECGIYDAPVDVIRVAKKLSAQIRKEAADQYLSGFLLRDLKSKSVIIGVNSRHHENRQRFTISHELGHLMLHEGELIHVDKHHQGFQVNLRDAKSGQGIDVKEKEANLFAAELLMPASFLARDLKNSGALDLLAEGSLKKIASKYKVSVQALTIRLSHLNYVDL
jgi:Zn-dependent peptidase ImmA (M78 family)